MHESPIVSTYVYKKGLKIEDILREYDPSIAGNEIVVDYILTNIDERTAQNICVVFSQIEKGSIHKNQTYIYEKSDEVHVQIMSNAEWQYEGQVGDPYNGVYLSADYAREFLCLDDNITLKLTNTGKNLLKKMIKKVIPKKIYGVES